MSDIYHIVTLQNPTDEEINVYANQGYQLITIEHLRIGNTPNTSNFTVDTRVVTMQKRTNEFGQYINERLITVEASLQALIKVFARDVESPIVKENQALHAAMSEFIKVAQGVLTK